MVVRLSLGVLPINGRRGGRKEEFNPFAKDASQQHRRRRDERERQHPRRPAAPVEQPVAPKKDIKADLERKQREAIEKLEQKGDVVAPEVAPAPVPLSRGPARQNEERPVVLSHEDHLAELRRKSEAAKQNASRIESAPDLKAAEPQTVKPVSTVEAHSSDSCVRTKKVSKREHTCRAILQQNLALVATRQGMTRAT